MPMFLHRQKDMFSHDAAHLLFLMHKSLLLCYQSSINSLIQFTSIS